MKVKEREDKWRWLKGGRWGQTTFIEGDNDNTIKQTICPPELLCRGDPNIENITIKHEHFVFIIHILLLLDLYTVLIKDNMSFRSLTDTMHCNVIT